MENEKTDTMRKTKLKVLLVLLSLIIIVPLAVVLLVIFLPRKNKEIALDISVASFFIDENGEATDNFRNEFTFDKNDKTLENNTQDLNFEDSYPKIYLRYSIKNVTGLNYDYKIEFAPVEFNNCSVYYQRSGESEHLIDADIIKFQSDKDFIIDIIIKVDDIKNSAVYKGNVSLTISVV